MVRQRLRSPAPSAAGTHRRARIVYAALPLVWATFGLANLGSYRGYLLVSVMVFAGTAGWIAAALLRPAAASAPPRGAWLSTVVVLAVGSVVVFQPTYLTPSDALRMRMSVLVCTIALAVIWSAGSRAVARASLGVSAVVLAVTAWFPVRGVPVPGNDVWFLLQQSADGLVRGENMYRTTWQGVPPGQVTDAFAYLPMSSVLFAPARWLTGDVRWGLAVMVAASAVLLLGAARGGAAGRGLWFAPACLLVLTPGHALQVEMTWTEPLILVLVLGAVLATSAGRRWWPVVLLALALASKQHVWLLLPLFAVWRPFGPVRAGQSALGAVLMCLPWVVADPRAMFDDTVGAAVGSVASDRISTVHALLGRWGVDLPIAVALAVVLATVVWCCMRVRACATPAQFCLAAALALLVANLMSKHAYYNQWWLCGSLVLAAVAFSTASEAESPERVATVAQGRAETATKQNSL